MPYPRLAEPPQPQPGQETRAQYGARLFAWFLSDAGTTVTMSDDALELAEYAGRTASTARDMLPAYYDRVSQARHELIAAIARRAAADSQAAPAAPTAAERPTIGPMSPVPLQPAPTAPSAPAAIRF